MKIFGHFLVMAVVFSMPGVLTADNHKEMEPYKGSEAFEKIKTLVGVWEGTHAMEKGEKKVKVEYKVTAGGSAVVETSFPGTPHEMISVYHDRDGELSMVHYCMLGNQPQMDLQKEKDNSLSLRVSKKAHKSFKNKPHMQGLKITFKDKDNIDQAWTMFDQGKKKEETIITLSRVP